MKYLIASDIHGSAYYTQKIIEASEHLNADKIILLGDIYNHGPRNPLPRDYAPMRVADILNAHTKNLIVIKGNCDSDVDTLISEFDFIPHLVMENNGKSFFLTHGDKYNIDCMPKTQFDYVIYGHFHTCFIKKIGGITLANPGSVSLPKNGAPHSFILIDDSAIAIYDLDYNLLQKE